MNELQIGSRQGYGYGMSLRVLLPEWIGQLSGNL
jgi:hypothetical protein